MIETTLTNRYLSWLKNKLYDFSITYNFKFKGNGYYEKDDQICTFEYYFTFEDLCLILKHHFRIYIDTEEYSDKDIWNLFAETFDLVDREYVFDDFFEALIKEEEEFCQETFEEKAYEQFEEAYEEEIEDEKFLNSDN